MEVAENLREITEDAVDRYRDTYGDEPPTTWEDIQEIMEEGETAEQQDIDEFLETQTQFYDQLLDADYGRLTEDLNERVRYQASRGQIARDMFNPMNAGFTLAGTPLTLGATMLYGPPELAVPVTAAGTVYANYKLSEITNEGAFMPGKDLIGVSNESKSKPDAYKVLASELFHAYQYEEGSDTWHHPFLREGLERASSVKALEQEYPEKGEAFRTHVLLTGSFQADEMLDKEIVDELDLPQETREQLEKDARKLKHSEYNLPAALIYAAEETEGEEIYGELFNNDYSSIEQELELLKGKGTKAQNIKSLFWKTVNKVA